MKQFWDERYASAHYVYGEEPNAFLKAQLNLLEPGSILFPAEGEGRNAVYAATQGWHAYAFDQSEEGQKKALRLAEKKGVSIDYQVCTFPHLPYQHNQFDVIALIFAHFPAAEKTGYLKELTGYLKPGGHIIFEAFSKNHLKLSSENPKAGGPKDPDILYSVEEIASIFTGFDSEIMQEETVELEEGLFHIGTSSVIRFTGKKR